MNYTLYNTATGAITGVGVSPVEDIALLEGEAWVEGMPPTSDYHVDLTTLTFAPGRIDSRPPELILAAQWAQVRLQRDQMLASTDWAVTKAVETGTPMPEGLATYRQALRDITLQADPFDLTWPVR